ncbi:alpha/beta hydrolase fold protein [Cordyceps fumosorosea ARSEF 2679]|uniref:Alpha/beta hydrolase fold protein n=1 Tax=Cordyceps fumosorosea (strain ARSEF 2679) TaxID=1081104 RepID=A0A167SWJ4_CORFA|nr:alpha/beta hydrolase fold protein [Cordyceps fumosorosea ARSEF 2679]OAA60001.1 alpha/beta hydrolase fold protein [Cordyceps fumosorosea ARSEF 2679]
MSVAERLVMIIKLLTIFPVSLAANILRMLVLSAVHGMRPRAAILAAVVRTTFGILTGKEIQKLQPTTRQEYSKFIQYAAKRWSAPNFKSRVVHDVQELAKGVDDSAILWLGDRSKAKKVVLFLHGGGYVLPASPGHFLWAWNTYVMAGVEAGVETAVAFLQYTLAPRGVLPVPLRQTVAAYEEIRAQGFQPRDIVVGGDSAGGNLTMQFLGHALHQQPAVPEVKLSEPLAGAFLVSAWLGQSDDTESFRVFGNNDMVSSAIVQKLSVESVEPHKRATIKSQADPWSRPLEADFGWFRDFETVVPKIYVTYGGREVLRDHSLAIIETIKREAPAVNLLTYEAPKELHDGVLVEHLFKKPDANAKKMKTWFKSVIIQ